MANALGGAGAGGGRKFAATVVGLVIGVAVGFYVLSALLPDAFSSFYDADMNATGADDSVIGLWNVIPLFAVLAVLIAFITPVMKRL